MQRAFARPSVAASGTRIRLWWRCRTLGRTSRPTPPQPGRRARPGLTMGAFVRAFRRKSTAAVLDIVHRALQNARANQCVAPSERALAERSYHAGDVNERGVEAVLTLRHRARGRPLRRGLRFGAPLPRARRRSAASRTCGCRARATASNECVFADGACVPRDGRARGFPGVAYHPDQSERATTEAQRRRVRRAARASHGGRARRRRQLCGRQRRAPRRHAVRGARPATVADAGAKVRVLRRSRA